MPAANTRPHDLPVPQTADGVFSPAPDAPDQPPLRQPASTAGQTGKTRPLIGYVRDDALWFYYEENLEALRHAGADLAELSLLDAAPWPEMDGLYLGGGFPELFGPELAASPHLADIRRMSEQNLPVYAECGGFMVLCQALDMPDGVCHAMAGLLPVRTRFFPRPQGLGYVEAVAVRANPFHPEGAIWRGHEFHYSRCETGPATTAGACPANGGPGAPAFVLRLNSGTGMGKTEDGTGQDGLCVRHTFASYTHLFAPAVPHWAERFVALAREYGRSR